MSLPKTKLCQQRLPQFGVSSASCKSSKQTHDCSRCIHNEWYACAHMPRYVMNVFALRNMWLLAAGAAVPVSGQQFFE